MKKIITALAILLALFTVSIAFQGCAGTKHDKYDCPRI